MLQKIAKCCLAASLIIAVFQQPVARGELVQFNLAGCAGTGILSANELPASGGGSGGETGNGIVLDTDTGMLEVNVGWRTENGFADLTSPVTLFNLHGPTASPAPASFLESGPALISLDPVDLRRTVADSAAWG